MRTSQVIAAIHCFYCIALFCFLASDTLSQENRTSSESLIPGRSRLKFPPGIRTSEQWKEHVSNLHERMKTVMGEPDSLKEMGTGVTKTNSVSLEMQVTQDELRNGIRYRKIQYNVSQSQQIAGLQRINAWLLTPINMAATKELSAVLCLHQTNGSVGKDEPTGLRGSPGLHYALELTQLGFVTLSPDYPSFGEYEYDFRDAQFASGTMKAISDNQRAIDLLQSLPEVDGSKIACIGHSLGGHNAIFTAAFEPRIRAVVSSCGFTRFHRYMKGDLAGWTSDRYMPRIQSEFKNDPDLVPFDFPELIGSLAPRGFLAVAPLSDNNFDVQGVRETMDFAKQSYALFEAINSLQADYPDTNHEFPEASRQRAYKFIEQQLSSARSNQVDADP